MYVHCGDGRALLTRIFHRLQGKSHASLPAVRPGRPYTTSQTLSNIHASPILNSELLRVLPGSQGSRS